MHTHVYTHTHSHTRVTCTHADCDAKKLGTKPYEAECDEESSSFGIAGGSVCFNGATVGSAATYSCLNCGYTLQGSDTRRCLMDDTWSGRTPLCDCKYSCIAIMIIAQICSDILPL